jgi:PleD family two-component response regulator
MPTVEPTSQPFAVLVAIPDDLRPAALDGILPASGYAVIHAGTGDEAVELACLSRPDAVIVGAHHADMTGVDVCRRICGDPRFPATTPVFLLTSDSSRGTRVAAYRAGVWDVWTGPLDEEILPLKLRTFVRARMVGERLRSGCLVDGETGLYTYDGLVLRARELGAMAARCGEPLACIALSPVRDLELGGPGAFGYAAIEQVAGTCRRVLRRSDVIGRVSATEFGVIAPATHMAGAAMLAGRIGDRVSAGTGTAVRAAYCAVANYAESQQTCIELLGEALYALRERSGAISMGGTPVDGASMSGPGRASSEPSRVAPSRPVVMTPSS